MADLAIASFIFRCTNGGERIGTARDTVLAPYGKMSLAWWLEKMGAKHRIVISHKVDESKPVFARIEYGRWLAECPLCHEYIDVDWREPIFACVACGGMELKTRLHPVIFPDDRIAIETQLLRRKNIWNRNWKPGETLSDLVVEYAVLEGKE